MTAELALTVAETLAREVRLEARFVLDAPHSVHGLLHPELLSKPFMLSLAPDGAIEHVRFASAVPGDHRAALRALLASVQLSLAPSTRWTRIERDATGEYEAHYERRAAGHVTRTMAGYRRLTTAEGLVDASSAEVRADGRSEFVLDDEHRIVTLRGTMRIALKPTSSAPTLHAASDVTVKLLRVEEYESETGWDALDAPEHLAQFAGMEMAQQMQDVDLEGQSFESVVTQIEQLANLPHDQAVGLAGSLPRKLATLLRHDPRQLHALTERLSSPKPMSPLVQSAYIGGIAQAETKDAIRGLAGLLDADIEKERRSVIMVALAQGKADPIVIDALEAQARSRDPHDDPSTARLALGNLSRQLDDEQREEHDPVRDLITAWGAARGDAQAQRVILLALGNSGDLRGLPCIKEVLAGTDVSLREAALFALRRMPSEVANGYLYEAIAGNVTSAERVAALQALAGRSLAPFAELLTRLTHAEDTQVAQLASGLLQAAGLLAAR